MSVDCVLRVVPAGEDPARGALWWRRREYPCALGSGGILPASRKREADNASPAGLFPLCRLYYRPDRLERPVTALEVLKIDAALGWCDDPESGDYNRAVTLPFPNSAETLWRDDGVYDLLVVIGHNQAPARPGRGSAIFLHVARDDFSPTCGCVAVTRAALLEILPDLGPQSMIRIYAR